MLLLFHDDVLSPINTRLERTSHNPFTHSPIHSFIHSFIISYSFNVEVDIAQLQTDREARKEDRIIISLH